jgi:hypothetical protein
MGTEVPARGGPRTSVPVFLLAILHCLGVSGCSLVLFGVGTLADAATPEYDELKGDEIEEMPKNSEVSVLTVDGSSSKGKYKGLYETQETDKVKVSPTYLRIRTSFDYKDIDVRRIIYVRKKNTHHAKWALLAAGIALDAVLVYLAISLRRGLRDSF